VANLSFQDTPQESSSKTEPEQQALQIQPAYGTPGSTSRGNN